MRHLPAFKAASAAAAGIVAGRYLEQYSIVFLSCAVATFFISAGLLFLPRERRATATAGAYLTLALTFAFNISIGLISLDQPHLEEHRFFAGTVDEIPRDSSRPSIVLTDCLAYSHEWRRISGTLIVTPHSPLPLMVGDRMFFKGRPGVVSDARNPGEFNLRDYYRLSGIAGRVFVDSEANLIQTDHGRGLSLGRDVVTPVRDCMRKKMSEFLSRDELSLAKAMVIGERMSVDKALSESFMRSGTIHILAVSGLHIGFLTGILMTLTSLLRIPRRWRFFLISPILLLYAAVVGMTPSVTRAVLMAIVILFGHFLQRRSRAVNSLGFAALVILAFSPSELFSPGFQLSFAAVISIAFFYERMSSWLGKLYPTLVERPALNSIISVSLLTLAATLGTVPLVAYYFERISLVGLFTNLLIVPLAGIFISLNFTFILLSLFLPSVASIYAAAAHFAGYLILQINSIAASFSLSSIRTGESRMLFGLLYLIWLAAVFGFGRKSVFKRLIFAILFGANLVVWASAISDHTSGRLFVLDVGQGDAIYLELPGGKNMLIDTGVRFGKYDTGSRVIVPFLKKRGVEHLDYLVITHLHSDHIGGAASVLRSLRVARFVYPAQVSHSRTWANTLLVVRALSIPSQTVNAGSVLDSGSLYRVYILHPNKKYVGESGISAKTRFNNGSIVLKVCIGNQAALLTGDVEQPVEHDLTRVYGSFLRSCILKAGHHGSATSSSQEFLDAVRARYTVVSVGQRNSFGHPSKDVISRMRLCGMKVMRTDSLGAACFLISLQKTRILSWR